MIMEVYRGEERIKGTYECTDCVTEHLIWAYIFKVRISNDNERKP